MSQATKQLLKEEIEEYSQGSYSLTIDRRYNTEDHYQISGNIALRTEKYTERFPEEPGMVFWLNGWLHYDAIIPKIKGRLLDTAKAKYSFHIYNVNMWARPETSNLSEEEKNKRIINGTTGLVRVAAPKFPEIYEKFKEMAIEETKKNLKKFLLNKFACKSKPMNESFKQFFKESIDKEVAKAFGEKSILDEIINSGKWDRSIDGRWFEASIRDYDPESGHAYIRGTVGVNFEEGKKEIPEYPKMEFFVRGLYMEYFGYINTKKKTIEGELDTYTNPRNHGEILAYDRSEGEYYNVEPPNVPVSVIKKIKSLAYWDTKKALQRFLTDELYNPYEL